MMRATLPLTLPYALRKLVIIFLLLIFCADRRVGGALLLVGTHQR
jgi:hypothetical protein